MKVRFVALLYFAGALATECCPAAEVTFVAAVVKQPRPFGYVVGDLIEQRILLEARGKPVDPLSLPTAGRVGVWLERRAPAVVTDAGGHHWLIINYQLITAPQGLTTVNLPPWQVASRQGGPTLRVPQWPISVAALTGRTVIAQGGLQELRADRPAPIIPTQPIVGRLQLWLGTLTLTLAGWVAWLVVRNWRASSNQPFARAARELRKLDDASPEAWQAMHRAFDSTAGKVLQSATLPVLFQRANYLEPLRPRIEDFFAQSTERFFGGGGGAPATRLVLHELCGDLLRLERRNER